VSTDRQQAGRGERRRYTGTPFCGECRLPLADQQQARSDQMADPRRHDAPGRPGEIPERGTPRRNSPEGADRTREAVDDVRRTASSLLDETRRDGRQMLDRQKDAATEQVGAVASALRSAADDLHRHDDQRAGRFVEFAADRLESFGNMVRNRDIDSLIDDAERLGRRSPAAFFAGSIALGFLLSRFLKSSARSPINAQARRDGETQMPPANASESVAATAPYPTGAADRAAPSTTRTSEVTR
jgi:hypothetical protein